MGFLREPSHLLLILVVVVVLFGSRRLPDAARGLGRSMRIFKSEVKQMKEDDVEPGRPAAGETRAVVDPEPLEGRVVRNESVRTESVHTESVRNDSVPSEPRTGERRDA